MATIDEAIEALSAVTTRDGARVEVVTRAPAVEVVGMTNAERQAAYGVSGVMLDDGWGYKVKDVEGKKRAVGMMGNMIMTESGVREGSEWDMFTVAPVKQYENEGVGGISAELKKIESRGSYRVDELDDVAEGMRGKIATVVGAGKRATVGMEGGGEMLRERMDGEVVAMCVGFGECVGIDEEKGVAEVSGSLLRNTWTMRVNSRVRMVKWGALGVKTEWSKGAWYVQLDSVVGVLGGMSEYMGIVVMPDVAWDELKWAFKKGIFWWPTPLDEYGWKREDGGYLREKREGRRAVMVSYPTWNGMAGRRCTGSARIQTGSRAEMAWALGQSMVTAEHVSVGVGVYWIGTKRMRDMLGEMVKKWEGKMDTVDRLVVVDGVMKVMARVGLARGGGKKGGGYWMRVVRDSEMGIAWWVDAKKGEEGAWQVAKLVGDEEVQVKALKELKRRGLDNPFWWVVKGLRVAKDGGVVVDGKEVEGTVQMCERVYRPQGTWLVWKGGYLVQMSGMSDSERKVEGVRDRERKVREAWEKLLRVRVDEDLVVR